MAWMPCVPSWIMFRQLSRQYCSTGKSRVAVAAMDLDGQELASRHHSLASSWRWGQHFQQ